ncbi:sodium:solute symporter [Planctomyces sp. SH-PL62]|uniref:sodium:solute symporter n=1 Tax=Planctomyces sp. SH-PL62 TaxID=1636152 RepID=UPI00078C56FE|nr:sodium:solute symporter [Planctomyces sp. SH-PL62]AMV35821.1 Sodium/glucose cotransporter [Planctomyces sp. SH-PL62]
MHPIDVTIIVIYILGCTALGGWIGGKGDQGLKGYFLGERNMPAWAVMISIVATETSTVTFLSVPGEAYKGNFEFLQLPMGYLVGRVIVSMVLLPAYFKGQIETAYQVLGVRFGQATRRTASTLFLVTRNLADGLRLFLAATVLAFVTDWPILYAIIAVESATIVYTYLGGVKAVIWADVLQFTVYIVGALIALYILVGKLPGGWNQLIDTARAGDKFRTFDFSFDWAKPYTFWAGVFGGMVLNTATHGVDQMMVQRYLAARSQKQAAGALIASGFVVLAQFALFLFIGVALYVFFGQFPPASPLEKSDQAFSLFIVNYLPIGIKGMVVAAIFASAMGVLSGSLNASASTLINDLYRPISGDEDERRLMRLSRLATIGFGVVQASVAWWATGLESSVVSNALAIAGFTTGILLGLFLLGNLTRHVGQGAALAGMAAGVAAVSYAKFGTPLAWPWFALVGSATTFLVGLAVGRLFPTAAAPVPASESLQPTS